MSRIVQLPLRKLSAITAAAGLAMLAACAAPPPPAPPPPPVAVVVVPEPEPIPMRPIPPGGAAADMTIPVLGVDGVRQTVNAHLDPLETVWNFRSALNVAALNCLDPQYQPILDNYKTLLTKQGKRLSKVNADLDKQYRKEFGAGAKATRAREAYMTQVYNYFALPPARQYFCDAALQVSQDALATPPADIDAFAQVSLPRIEAAFEQFFQEMEKYRIAVADWDNKYGAVYGSAAGGAAYLRADYGPAGAPDVTSPSAPPVVPDYALPSPQTSYSAMPGGVQTGIADASGNQPAFGSQPVVQQVP
ncbi:hypothetical protein H0274_13600 [Altererythrobacter sp. CC-YST694]|uniref:hypothetical protein n=1 Tax=Altererythrobacter sp. CC-YST694 TaxID=2755038 RepID=UPI001D022F0F|nr:hypothetical protein [Altererythrobacter sp. CC-YST694]MCB5426298.1 hypothetical protein [Altererythrobacter sp. CC-YST694]